MKKLCIAIPTYNRAGLLIAQLQRLLPQLKPDVHLHVFDNASTDDTAAQVNALKCDQVLLTSSPFNAGMARNICKALEEADAEWVWVLGDDDPVTPDAVAEALKMCGEAGVGVIEFDSMGGEVKEDRRIDTLEELYRYHDPIRSLFISSHLFHKASVTPYFSILAPGCFTFGPHTALIIRLLENSAAPLWLRKESLIQPVFTVKGWSTLEVALGMSLLPEFIKSPSMQQQASRRLLMDTGWMLSFGLREVVDASAARRWKRITQQTLFNLSAYGAGWLPLGDRYRRPDRREIKDFLIARLGLFLPISLLVRMGKKLRDKYSHDRNKELKDF